MAANATSGFGFLLRCVFFTYHTVYLASNLKNKEHFCSNMVSNFAMLKSYLNELREFLIRNFLRFVELTARPIIIAPKFGDFRFTLTFSAT